MLNFTKNYPIFQQLIVPMLIIGLIGTLASTYSAFVLKESVAVLDQSYLEGDKKLRIIEELETHIANYRSAGLRHMVSESSSVMKTIHTELKVLENKIRYKLELVSINHSDDHIEHTKNKLFLSGSTKEYIRSIDEVIELSTDFEKEQAFILFSEIESRHLSQLNTSLSRLKLHEYDDLSILRETLKTSTEKNLLLTVAIGIFIAAILLLIAYIFTRRIAQRLDNLIDWSKHFSAGNMSAPLISSASDEIGKLSNSMIDMAKNIQIAHHDLQKAKNNAEKNAEKLKIYANAFEYSGEAIMITDQNNHILNINAAFTKLTGYDLNEIAGKNPKILSGGKTPSQTYQQLWQDLTENGFWQGELWDKKKNGQIYPKWASISAIKDSNDGVLFFIASFSDISERKESESRIEHLAHHDILTGLHNRFSLESCLQQAVLSSNREQQQLAVLFIDLDRFKLINDTLGHHIGDELLISVAQRLKLCVRESDIVARIGGDEFVIVLQGIKDNSQAAVTAKKILRQLSKPFLIQNNKLNTSPSIGISIYPVDGNDVSKLLQTADAAMYHAKEKGRNSYYYFNKSMFVAANERIQIERELNVALAGKQFELNYQPLVQSSNLKLVALEVLIRWNHPTQGIISPNKFISIAENAGLIHEIGVWVFENACCQLAEWKSNGLYDCKLAINLTAKQLQSEHLVDQIKSTLQKYQIDGSEIELEITESVAMNGLDQAIKNLFKMAKLGIHLVIDDFGTGYSSLAYLKKLPINSLKLDSSFVQNIEDDPGVVQICIATIELAHNLGLKVVAEGVENEPQQKFMMDHHCDYQQGCFFCEPLPVTEMTVYLDDSFRPYDKKIMHQ